MSANVVRVCGGLCPTGYAVEEDGRLWSGMVCNPKVAELIGAAIGGEGDACAVAAADAAVGEGVVDAQQVYLAGRTA